MLTNTHSKWIWSLALLIFAAGCGGYKAADDEDIVARSGEIVGVLVNDKGKSQPDSTIQLFSTSGTEAIVSVTGIDSDGRFGIFPADSGVYNVVGIMGDLDKAIAQNLTFNAGDAMNIGTMQTKKVAGLTVYVKTPEAISPEGILVEVLGYSASAVTVTEGLGAIATGIPAGTYSVRFSKSGLTTQVVDNVVLAAGEVTVLENVTMTAAE